MSKPIPKIILETMVLDFANRQYPLTPLSMGAVWFVASTTRGLGFHYACNTRMREIWVALSEDVQNEIANLFGDDIDVS